MLGGSLGRSTKELTIFLMIQLALALIASSIWWLAIKLSGICWERLVEPIPTIWWHSRVGWRRRLMWLVWGWNQSILIYCIESMSILRNICRWWILAIREGLMQGKNCIGMRIFCCIWKRILSLNRIFMICINEHIPWPES